ncbi:hypothetical protein DRN63_02305 [Nanoarchaeota archaeon]|nr:MAG: hypothetical protein DRN63_02305 [Nanoarchaeota archaeon]
MKLETRKDIIGYSFLLPFLIVIFYFIFIPVFITLLLGFYDVSSFQYTFNKFVGLKNFERVLVDPVYWRSLINASIIAVFNVLALIISTFLAELLNIIRRGYAKIAEAILFFPFVLPLIVSTWVWRQILRTDGVLGFLINSLGVNPFNLIPPEGLLGAYPHVVISIVAVEVWYLLGFLTVIIRTALSEVPKEYIEAAKIDGATWWNILTKIKVPYISPTLTFLLVLCLIWAFFIFDIVFMLTYGGPGSASQVPALWMIINAFRLNKPSYATAMTTLTIAIVGGLIFLILGLRILRGRAT